MAESHASGKAMLLWFAGPLLVVALLVALVLTFMRADEAPDVTSMSTPRTQVAQDANTGRTQQRAE